MKKDNPWLKFANDDFDVLLLVEHSDVYRAICFHSQELSEKILKAALFEQGKKIPKTHHIAYLVRELGIKIPVENQDLEFLSSVYVDSRYPPDFGLLPSGEPDKEDAKQAMRITKEVYTYITEKF